MYPKFRKTKPQIPSIIDYLGKINNSHISHDSHICHSSSKTREHGTDSLVHTSTQHILVRNKRTRTFASIAREFAGPVVGSGRLIGLWVGRRVILKKLKLPQIIGGVSVGGIRLCAGRWTNL